MEPVRLFRLRSRLCKFVMSSIAVGIVPAKWLFFKERDVREVSLMTEDKKSPVQRVVCQISDLRIYTWTVPLRASPSSSRASTSPLELQVKTPIPMGLSSAHNVNGGLLQLHECATAAPSWAKSTEQSSRTTYSDAHVETKRETTSTKCCSILPTNNRYYNGLYFPLQCDYCDDCPQNGILVYR